MTYTIRDCISYSNTSSILKQGYDSAGRLIYESSINGFQGPDRVKKAVKRALKELWWDEKQGFTGGEVYVQGKGVI